MNYLFFNVLQPEFIYWMFNRYYFCFICAGQLNIPAYLQLIDCFITFSCLKIWHFQEQQKEHDSKLIIIYFVRKRKFFPRNKLWVKYDLRKNWINILKQPYSEYIFCIRCFSVDEKIVEKKNRLKKKMF